MSDGSFLLSIIGQIELIDVLAECGTSWHCKYEFVTGPDWKIISGLEAGLSQKANVATNGDKITLNFPIEIIYKSTNPYGWPQIVFSVYQGMNLAGYGRIHVPLQVGLHQLKANLSKPQPSTLLGYLGTLFGYQAELFRPKILATTEGNNLIRMVSNGHIQLSMSILTQGFNDLGYDVGKNK